MTIDSETDLALLRRTFDLAEQSRARGDHPFAATEQQFSQISRHFVAPSPDEGFNVIVHKALA